MSAQLNVAKNDSGPEVDEQADLVEGISALRAELGTLSKLVARRFDEVSAEVNATSQQLGMAEEGLSQNFSQVFDVIRAITHKGDGNTAANEGIELDAVVDTTEEATNKIIDMAMRVSDTLGEKKGAVSEEELASIQGDLEEIIIACSFQDLTGQRIRCTLENIRSIEDSLNDAVKQLGLNIQEGPNELIEKNRATSQDDIDALFKTKA